MHAGVLGPDLIRDLLEVQIDPLRLQMVTDFIGEDQGFAVLRFVPPGLPRIAGPLALHDLFRITDFQQVHDRLGRAQCAGLPVLGRSQLRPSIVLGTTLQLLVDDNGPVLEVHTVPGQTQRLAFTQTGKEDHAENGAVVLIVLGFLQEVMYLLVCQRCDLGFVHLGELGFVARVLFDELELHRLLQRGPQHDVHIFDALGGEAFPIFIRADQIVVESLDQERRQILQIIIAESRNDVFFDLRLVSLQRRITLVEGEFVDPGLKPVLELDFGRLDIGVLADLGQKNEHFISDFSLGFAVNRSSDLLSRFGINANGVSPFPTSVRTLADRAGPAGASFILRQSYLTFYRFQYRSGHCLVSL